MENFEMPVVCSKCGTTFDLNDGIGSEKWFPNTVICERCGLDEEKEIERDDEIYDLRLQLDDAVFTINDCKKRLKEFGIDAPVPEITLPKIW